MTTAVIAPILVLLATLTVYMAWCKTQAVAAPSEDGGQELTVRVRGGYRPRTFLVRAGVPLRIHFLREEAAPCSVQVFLPDFGIARRLPESHLTTVELLPERHGDYLLTCRYGRYIGMMRARSRGRCVLSGGYQWIVGRGAAPAVRTNTPRR